LQAASTPRNVEDITSCWNGEVSCAFITMFLDLTVPCNHEQKVFIGLVEISAANPW
jgi:hypothetical protein